MWDFAINSAVWSCYTPAIPVAASKRARLRSNLRGVEGILPEMKRYKVFASPATGKSERYVVFYAVTYVMTLCSSGLFEML